MKRLILIALLSLSFVVPVSAANITITVDNTKAEELVDYLSGGETLTPQEKVQFLKDYILKRLKVAYRNMKDAQALEVATVTEEELNSLAS